MKIFYVCVLETILTEPMFALKCAGHELFALFSSEQRRAIDSNTFEGEAAIEKKTWCQPFVASCRDSGVGAMHLPSTIACKAISQPVLGRTASETLHGSVMCVSRIPISAESSALCKNPATRNDVNVLKACLLSSSTKNDFEGFSSTHLSKE